VNDRRGASQPIVLMWTHYFKSCGWTRECKSKVNPPPNTDHESSLIRPTAWDGAHSRRIGVQTWD